LVVAAAVTARVAVTVAAGATTVAEAMGAAARVEVKAVA